MTGSTERVGFGPKHGSCWSDTAAILTSECRDRGAILLLHSRWYFVALCFWVFIVGPLQRVRPRNGNLGLVLVVVLVVVVLVPLRSEFIGEL